MTDELKPVRCGCGGEAKVISYLSREYCKMAYYVRCVECGTETDDLHTEAEAITAWNRAMSGATDTNVGDKERTAKVEQQRTCWEDIRPYKEGMCASCGRDVYDHAKYCDECGARLEWDE